MQQGLISNIVKTRGNINKKMKIRVILGLIYTLFLTMFPGFCRAIDAWPGSAGTVIGTFSDASGAVWHEERGTIFVIQNTGRLNEIDTSGTVVDYWDIGGDLEGITLADNSRYLYIGVEHPDSIVEFDLQTEALSGKSWDLTTWMTGPDNSGLEGLTYRSGYFYAGLQNDGKIYVFNVNRLVSGSVSYVETTTPYSGYTDISGLEYNEKTGIIYAIFDTANALVELNSTNQTVNHYTLPGSAQEGIVVHPHCLDRVADIYIANDDTGQVIKYTGYPVTCLDADADGVAATSDCNDYDSTLTSNIVYYRDYDGDGLGDQYTTTSVCSNAAPDGYVTNNSDNLDIASSGRQMYINGSEYAFFTVDPLTVQFTNADFYGDAFEEVIAVALTNKKVAYITVAKVKGNSVVIAKRVRIKKKYRAVQIIAQLAKRKFITRFNGKKKYTWKINSSGSFSRSR